MRGRPKRASLHSQSPLHAFGDYLDGATTSINECVAYVSLKDFVDAETLETVKRDFYFEDDASNQQRYYDLVDFCIEANVCGYLGSAYSKTAAIRFLTLRERLRYGVRTFLACMASLRDTHTVTSRFRRELFQKYILEFWLPVVEARATADRQRVPHSKEKPLYCFSEVICDVLWALYNFIHIRQYNPNCVVRAMKDRQEHRVAKRSRSQLHGLAADII